MWRPVVVDFRNFYSSKAKGLVCSIWTLCEFILPQKWHLSKNVSYLINVWTTRQTKPKHYQIEWLLFNFRNKLLRIHWLDLLEKSLKWHFSCSEKSFFLQLTRFLLIALELSDIRTDLNTDFDLLFLISEINIFRNHVHDFLSKIASSMILSIDGQNKLESCFPTLRFCLGSLYSKAESSDTVNGQ